MEFRHFVLGAFCAAALSLPVAAKAPAWKNLSAAQQSLLYPVAHQWDRLSETRRSQLASQAARVAKSPASVQAQYREQLAQAEAQGLREPSRVVKKVPLSALPADSLLLPQPGAKPSPQSTFTPKAVGDVVGNPGTFVWTLVGGEVAIGEESFVLDEPCDPLDPACVPEEPDTVTFNIDAAGNFSLPQSTQLIPPVVLDVDGDPVTISFELTTPITGSINPESGAANLDANVSIRAQGRVSGVNLGNNCRIGTAGSPLALRFTTGSSGANGAATLVGVPYSPVGSALTLVDAVYSVPAASGCGGSLSFIVTPLINSELNLPSATGSNRAALAFTVSPVVLTPNETPVAVPQAATTVAGVPVTITLGGSDADGDALTYSIATAPANGTLDTSALPVVVYTPNAGFSGSDRFTFVVDDGRATSAEAAVQIDVQGETTATPQALETAANTPVTFTLAGESPRNAALTFAVVQQPANGRLDLSALPEVTYTPNAGFSGVDSLRFTADDGVDTSVPATVSITVQPEPAVATSVQAEAVLLAAGGSAGFTLGTGTLRARLVDADGAPVPGKTLAFEVASTTVCTATTNALGFASCRPTSGQLQLLLGAGYTARFAGDASHLASSGRAGLLSLFGTRLF